MNILAFRSNSVQPSALDMALPISFISENEEKNNLLERILSRSKVFNSTIESILMNPPNSVDFTFLGSSGLRLGFIDQNPWIIPDCFSKSTLL